MHSLAYSANVCLNEFRLVNEHNRQHDTSGYVSVISNCHLQLHVHALHKRNTFTERLALQLND